MPYTRQYTIWISNSYKLFPGYLPCKGLIVETVGVGQDEVDIARSAHTTIIVAVPGMGDHIVFSLSGVGIFEIGDIFVINKADQSDAR